MNAFQVAVLVENILCAAMVVAAGVNIYFACSKNSNAHYVSRTVFWGLIFGVWINMGIKALVE